MDQKIDLNYQPEGYFRPAGLRQHLITQVKDAAVRAHLERLLEHGDFEALDEFLGDTGVLKEDLEGLQSIHLSVMGDNYLPDLENGEVEIARIEIASTTGDVTSLYAKKLCDSYEFRVVDEYEGDTLSDNTTMKAELPLTLGQMVDFFFEAWPLIDVLEMNDLHDDIESALRFFLARSEFYPSFHKLCEERVAAHFGSLKQNDGLTL